jgi:hypothetical protein
MLAIYFETLCIKVYLISFSAQYSRSYPLLGESKDLSVGVYLWLIFDDFDHQHYSKIHGVELMSSTSFVEYLILGTHGTKLG